jgi:hypothetical protein
MPYFLLLVDYPSATGAAEKVALLADNLGSMRAMYLITYVVFGVVLAVLSLTLYRRLRDKAPVLALAGAAAGLTWAVVLSASGLVFIAGMTAVAGLHGSDPAQAATLWQAIEPVAQGLGGADGEILGGAWVLLVSVAALRTRSLPRPLCWLGVAAGAAGLLSVVPVLRDLTYGFGLLQIVWLVWLGVAMLRPAPRTAETAAPTRSARPVQLEPQRDMS